ncbi:hypothetical protein BD311DRAFT_8609 [Dichomitus squalens]|uniref:Uncharacterized protein n=1 Tax=Dichomitus squalens TaxID=114155 RepID=A0A4Q9N9A9_9APHY|nr:hypothetical protein BD311DRAFT_8609 [Dichomitus squalens]
MSPLLLLCAFRGFYAYLFLTALLGITFLVLLPSFRHAYPVYTAYVHVSTLLVQFILSQSVSCSERSHPQPQRDRLSVGSSYVDAHHDAVRPRWLMNGA